MKAASDLLQLTLWYLVRKLIMNVPTHFVRNMFRMLQITNTEM